MTTFYLVRHAHANWIPSEDRPLSGAGFEKAEDVARVLQTHPIDFIYSSPYRRAMQTVAPLAQQLELDIQVLDDLRERQLAGSAVDNFDEAINAVWHDPHFAHPGGESNSVAQKRGVVLINELQQQHPTDHLVLASHGNLLALILQHFDPTQGFEFWQSMSMPDIYRLDPGEPESLTRLWEG